MKRALIFCGSLLLLSTLQADTTYERAMMYIKGEVGASKESVPRPRCPYERCAGKSDEPLIITKKDLKEGYRLLKMASTQGDDNASYEALNILLKQIDYKSKRPDDYLVNRLEKNYGIDMSSYNQDVLQYASKLSSSKSQKFLCKGTYVLYEALKNSYFSIRSSDVNITIKELKESVLKNCKKTSFEYIKTNEGV